MANKSRNAIACLLMLVMVAVALLIGAERGWSGERVKVESTYSTLEDMLDARVEVACNLLTVAQRDVYKGQIDNDLITLVKQDKNVLEGGASLADKSAANERFTADAEALLNAMSALPDVKSDARDLMYVTQMLPQALEQSNERTSQAEYNAAARDYNNRFNGQVSGMLARLMGVKSAEEFVSE